MSRGTWIPLVLVILIVTLVVTGTSVAFAYPDTAWPGRDEYGDGCWNTNCHNVNDQMGTGPHGNYSSTSHICDICHTTHVAPGSFKLLPQETVTDTCFFCHDGTQATGKGVYGAVAGRGLTVAASHRVETTNAIPGGDAATGATATAAFSEGGNLGCGDCHTPHGSRSVVPYKGERARNTLRDTFRNAVLRSSRLLRQQPSGATTSVAEYGSDWCLTCHKGRVSGGSVHNHPVESSTTVAVAYVWDRVPMMQNDTDPVSVVVGSMGRSVPGTTGGSPYMALHNRAYVMPQPRDPLQAGHAPICMQCHQNARAVGAPGAVATAGLTLLDGAGASDNPRFQTFPHEATNPRFLVETDDDLCTNCHPAASLP